MATYNNVLDTAGKTAKTFGEMSKGINPKNVIALWGGGLLLVVFTIITIWLVKKALGNTAENFFDWLLRPYRTMTTRLKGVTNATATGTRTKLSQKEALEVADKLYSCFSPTGDDEERVYAILQQDISSAADWELVKAQFGWRVSPKILSGFGFHHEGDLEQILSENLSRKEKDTVRSILKQKGITPNF